MPTKTIKVTIEDQINYDNGYGDVDCDVTLEFTVLFREIDFDLRKAWEPYSTELDDAWLFAVDQDGGSMWDREWDDITEEQLKKYKEQAESKAREKIEGT